MKQVIRIFAGITLICLLPVSSVWAQVSITAPWVRATTTHQKATGAFMSLESSEPMTLVSASSPVAGIVEVHEMVTENSVMKMRAIPQLPLVPGKVMELKPGSYHIMLMELKAPVSTGQKVPLTLVFENQKKERLEQKVEAEVRALNTPASTNSQTSH